MVGISRSHYFVSLLLGAVFGIAAALFNTSQMIMLLPFVSTAETQLNVLLIATVAMFAPFAEELAKILPPLFLKTQENGRSRCC